MKWYLAGQDSPTTIKNRGVVLRHITDPAVIETIEYADQQKDKGERNSTSLIAYHHGVSRSRILNDVIPGQHDGKNNTPRSKSESSRIVILRKPEEANREDQKNRSRIADLAKEAG